jgi:fibronectin-binding autotransporter adhesin
MIPRPLPFLRKTFSTAALSLAAMAFAGLPAHAANKTWDGEDVDDSLWQSGDNWNLNAAPSPNDILIFAGTTRLDPTNDFAALTQFNGITFNAGAGPFVLGGNAITLGGNITNNATTAVQTINLPMDMGALRPVIGGVAASETVISGVLSGSAGFIHNSNTGIVTLTNDNPFSGQIGLRGGTLRLTNFNAMKNATFFTGEGSQVNTTATVELRSDTSGTFLTAGYFPGGDDGAQLTINVDRAAGGTGTNQTLTLGGTMTGATTVNATGANGYRLGLETVSIFSGTGRVLTLNPTTANMTVATITPPASNTVVLGGTSLDNIVTGAINAGGGTLTLQKTNASTWTLNGLADVGASGTASITGGTLVLGGTAGGLSKMPTFSDSTLILDNTGAGNNVADRLPTAALALANAKLVYKGSDQATTNSTETIGALTKTSGNSVVTVSFGGTNTATLTAASFIHTTLGQPTALVNGTNLGMDGTSTASVGRLILNTAPTLTGTTNATAAGINVDAQNTKIVPFLVGEATSAPGGLGTQTGVANTFVTYEASTGIRPLNPTDEFTNNAITATNNTRITSDTTSTANASINSLLMNGGNLTIDDGTTLTNTSGALLFASNGEIKPSGTTGALDFGTTALVTINSGVTATFSAPVTVPLNQFFNMSGAGTLKLGQTNALPTNRLITVNSGVTFDLAGFNQTTSSTFYTSPGSTLTNSVTGTSTLTTAGGGLAGLLQDGGPGKILALTTSANLSIGAGAADTVANTYTGLTTVNGGTLELRKAGGTNAIGGDVLVNGGGISYGFYSGVYRSHTIADTSNITVSGGTVSVNAEKVNSVTLNSGGTFLATAFSVSTMETANASGTGFTTINGGTWTVANFNSRWITDKMTISGGTNTVAAANGPGYYAFLQVGAGGLTINQPASGAFTALTLSNTGNATSNAFMLLNGTLTFVGNATPNTESVTIASTAGTGGNAANNSIRWTGDRIFDIGDGAANVDLILQPKLIASSGTASLTKDGAGTLQLDGASTYTGATTVNAGRLLVHGSLAGASATTVASGASFGGKGAIGALTVSSGGGYYDALSKTTAGAPPIADTDYFQTNVTGAVTLTGGDLQLTLGTGIEAGDIFYLIANDGTDAITGAFSSLNGNAATLTEGSTFNFGGYDFGITYLANAGSGFTGGNDLALQVVPEPQTWVTLLGGLGMLLGFQRRRRLLS